MSLTERRARRAAACAEHAGASAPVAFFFDLASPYTYLAAERVDRLFTGVTWVPTLGAAAPDLPAGVDVVQTLAAERRAAVLRMPLVWPDLKPQPARAAMRVAHHAAEVGRAAPFVLAATRLAYCGGFDIDDPSILAEAAAAAGLSLDRCLAAAGDRGIDAALRAAGEPLAVGGLDRLPALRVGRTIFGGEHRITEAMACARGRALPRRASGPLTPTGG